MSEYYDAEFDAYMIASEILDGGAIAVIKAVPAYDYPHFFDQLSWQFAHRGVKLVTIKYSKQAGFTLFSILEAFIAGLKSLWPRKDKMAKNLRSLCNSIKELSRVELQALTKECVSLAARSTKQRILPVFHWPYVPLTLEAMKFAKTLSDLTFQNHFRWCIFSSSPALMLFVDGTGYSLSDFYDHDYSRGFFNYLQTPQGVYHSVQMVYDVERKRWVSSFLDDTLVTFGTTDDCKVQLNIWKRRIELAIDYTNIISFSPYVRFCLQKQGSARLVGDPGLVTLKWADLSLTLQTDWIGPWGDESTVYIIDAYQLTSKCDNYFLTPIPYHNSIIRLRFNNPPKDRNFILFVR